ncbi:MAG: hypothetical protein GXZ04_00115 [Clostridiales bacterium]|nr:hypothetical protein [Clostridiales bacterium]
MTKQALVSYFYQSAFTVSLQKTLLVFSYRQKDVPQLLESAYLTEKDFHGFNSILVFVPSASAAHHDPAIYQWKQSFPITYIMPQEAAKTAPRAANVRVCREGDSFTVGYSEIKVFGSTDIGVSYLVSAEGLNVFHAGDLNLWHWREENSLREIAKAEALFYEKVAQIPKDTIDISFFPLDPNQGGFYDAGANHFIIALRPKVFFPMHFGPRGEIASEYARRAVSRRTTVFPLTQVRESALIDFSGSTPLVRSSAQHSRERREVDASVNLAAYIQADPFAQTDLPVQISEEKGTAKE